ncbi:hypothetical protein SLS62_004806 [Diatrype stigma]|uniref:Copper acquisition factor BIM1-like domain-containing protein n=1 Tax=Diatrype stigma TaxID=117547 RepID=A0AAN9YST8_9PEZI
MLSRLTTTALAAISLCGLPTASALFNLTAPAPLASLGGDAGAGGRAAPCGGADARDRSSVAEWPVGGLDVAWSSAEAQAGWQINAVLLSDNDGGENGTDFASKNNLRTLYTTAAAGPFCLAKVHGIAEWVGQDAVLQVQQWTGNGNYFYACSAIKFIDGEAPASKCNVNAGKMFRG